MAAALALGGRVIAVSAVYAVCALIGFLFGAWTLRRFVVAPQWTVEGPVERAVPESARPHLVATLREALANAGRHSGASQVNVRLEVGRAVTLEVTDDGRGIPADVTESGLRNLRDRAESLGGEFEAVSGQPTGTRLRWSVPGDQ